MKPSVSVAAAIAAVAVTAVVLGTTGAVAGSLITSKQIKDNTVASRDIKNGTVATKDISRKARKALHGTNGVDGARGVSAWDTIPSGKTVTGRFYEHDLSGATKTSVAENVNFPAKAPAAPTGYGFGPDSLAFTTDDPVCTGTFEAPSAPAGHVCVYMGGAEEIDAAAVSDWVGAEQNPYTFFVSFHQATANAVYEFWGNWAYTAP